MGKIGLILIIIENKRENLKTLSTEAQPYVSYKKLSIEEHTKL